MATTTNARLPECQSPHQSLRAPLIQDAVISKKPESPAVTHRRRGGRRNTRPQQDYMEGGQLRIGDLEAIHKFFYHRFFILEQNPCKRIMRFLIDAILYKKQKKFPYQGKPKRGRATAHLPDTRAFKIPGFWPSDIPYTGPDRMEREGKPFYLLGDSHADRHFLQSALPFWLTL